MKFSGVVIVGMRNWLPVEYLIPGHLKFLERLRPFVILNLLKSLRLTDFAR